jgi:EAL domain-containing protein (putative c-di-GMP-specific phosphodiesterase class I)
MATGRAAIASADGRGVVKLRVEHFEAAVRTRPILWTHSAIRVSESTGAAPESSDAARSVSNVTALTPDDLNVVFQPIVELATGRVFAHEALVRCKVDAFKNPVVLFEHAEREQFCGRLGRMIREVCFTRVTDGAVFVNLHPHELAERWLVRPDDALCFHSGPVYLEITESAALEHMDVTRQILKELSSRANARLVVDDFGVGHSDLFRVLELEPDVVKLDRSLVTNVHLDPNKAARLEYLIDLCTELGALVVAEGIESVEELRAVRAAGAPLAQGYLLARPQFPPPPLNWDDEWLAYVVRRSRRPVPRHRLP